MDCQHEFLHASSLAADGKLAMIDVRDIADSAARVLLDMSYAGKTYVRLNSSRARSWRPRCPGSRPGHQGGDYLTTSSPFANVANLPLVLGCTGSFLDQGHPPNWSFR